MAQKMDIREFEERLRMNFPHTPTAGQERLLYVFSKFLFSEKSRCALIIKGYAGTGKTTVTGAIVKTLKGLRRKVVLMAPTGRAAKVLSSFSDHPAYTIHRTIYRQTGGEGSMSFSLSANRHKNALFIVDEASMIAAGAAVTGNSGYSEPYDLLDDLMEYIYSGEGCRLLLIGDSAQLPPVGSDESPALSAEYLERHYHLTIAALELNEVVRQELDSGILYNANTLRLQVTSGGSGFPRLNAGFNDLIRLEGSELQETLESLFSRYGEYDTVIITRSNKRANLFNKEVRQRILWKEEEISAGDLLMVVRNNYHWLSEYKDAPTSFLANGDTLEVQRVNKRQEFHGFRFADLTVRLIDYPEFKPVEVKVMLDVLDMEQANLGFNGQKELYQRIAEDYRDLGNRKKIHKAIMADPFYNALQIKFAYAVTCHKSQGGQWPAVIVDQGYLTEEMLDTSLLRWFYTAFTRSQKELYLLNFSDEFFG